MLKNTPGLWQNFKNVFHINKNIKPGNEPKETFGLLYMNALRLTMSYSSYLPQSKQTGNFIGKLIM